MQYNAQPLHNSLVLVSYAHVLMSFLCSLTKNQVDILGRLHGLAC